MNRDEILEELVDKLWPLTDYRGPTLEFLEDYWAIGDTRLSVLVGENCWATVFEWVLYHGKCDEFQLHVWIFGNLFRQPTDEELTHFERIPFFLYVKDTDGDGDGISMLSRDKIKMIYHGKRLEIAVSDADLQEARVELSSRQAQKNTLTYEQFLRFLCEKWNHPFFLSEDALRDVLDARALDFSWKFDQKTERSYYKNAAGEWDEPPIPSLQLEILLQTRHWKHPIVTQLDENEAETALRETLAPVADLIATRDLEAWHAQDATQFNSDWRVFAKYEAKTERQFEIQIAQQRERFLSLWSQLSPEERTFVLPVIAESVERCRPTYIEERFSFFRYKRLEFPIFAELRDELESLLRETPSN